MPVPVPVPEPELAPNTTTDSLVEALSWGVFIDAEGDVCRLTKNADGCDVIEIQGENGVWELVDSYTPPYRKVTA